MSVYAYTKMITCNLKRLYFIHLKLKIYLNDVWTSFQICFTKYYFSRRTCKLSHCMRCRLEVSGSFAYATGEKISCMQAEQWTSMNVHVPSSNTPIRTREQRSQKGKQKLLLDPILTRVNSGAGKESRRRAWRSTYMYMQESMLKTMLRIWRACLVTRLGVADSVQCHPSIVALLFF
jgi:hypothetical protein